MPPMGLSATPVGSAFMTGATALSLAEASRWRAPDVTAVLADHAARLANADGDLASALRAEGWLAHGLITIGHGWSAAPRAAAALAESDRLGETAAADRLRVELAGLARTVEVPALARTLLDPVLGRNGLSTVLRADAFLEASLSADQSDHAGLLDTALAAFHQIEGEAGELALAHADALRARWHRTRGELPQAIERAREGLRRTVGDRPAHGALEPSAPRLATVLCVELCIALADSGRPGPIQDIAKPVLDWAMRPALLEPAAALRMVLASRVYWPAGNLADALSSAGWVAEAVEARDLPELEAQAHGLLAEVREANGELAEALAANRKSGGALRLHGARLEQARTLLAQVADGSGTGRSQLPEPAPATRFGIDPASGSGGRGESADQFADADRNGRSVRNGHPVLSGHAELNGHGAENFARNGSSTVANLLEPMPPSDPASGEGRLSGRRRAPEPAEPLEPQYRAQLDDRDLVVPESFEPSHSTQGIAGQLPPADPFLSDQTSDSAPPSMSGELLAPLAPSGPQLLGERASSAPITGRRRRPEPSESSSPRGENLGLDERSAGDDLDVMWLSPQAPTEPKATKVAGPVWLTSGQLGDRLTELGEVGSARPAHLVVVDIAAPDTANGDDSSRVAIRIAEQVGRQLPDQAHLFLVSPDSVIIALSETDQQAVSRWIRSMSSGLSGRWAELSHGLDRAMFRIAVRPLDPAWTMAEHVREVQDRLGGSALARGLAATPTKAEPTEIASDDSARSGRHGGAAHETEMPTGRFRATPGSGGRRRRPEPGEARTAGYPSDRPVELSEDSLAGSSIGTEDSLAGSSIGTEDSLAGSSIGTEDSLAGSSIGTEGPLAGSSIKTEDRSFGQLAGPAANLMPSWPADQDAGSLGSERELANPGSADFPANGSPSEWGHRMAGVDDRDVEPGDTRAAELDLAGMLAGGLRLLQDLDADDPGHSPEEPELDQKQSSSNTVNGALPGVDDATDAEGDAGHTGSEPPPPYRPPSYDRPVSELSFVELIDGALAAYREA